MGNEKTEIFGSLSRIGGGSLFQEIFALEVELGNSMNVKAGTRHEVFNGFASFFFLISRECCF